MLKGKNILIISNEPWGDVWYSKHNYAYELSKNNTVFFVNPPSKWSPINIFKLGTKKKYSENLFIVDYFNVIPAKNKILFYLNNRIVSQKLKIFLSKNKFCDFIFWSFDPYRLFAPKVIGASKSVFHAVDNYQFNHWGEKKLANNVDNIICVSSEISKNYVSFNKKILVVPHALSTEEFSSSEKPNDIPSGDFALYVGNIDKRLDYKQIEQVVKKFTAIKFVFIGKLSFDEKEEAANNIFRNKKYSNVTYLGVKKFKELKNYIFFSKFCFAFMNSTFHGNRIAHHKIYQYLALGKPVFCSSFSDYIEIKNYLYMEDETDRIIQNIDSFLTIGENKELERKRISIAMENTFNEILKKIEQFLYE